jgi:pilus assembly protein Flp/PilA
MLPSKSGQPPTKITSQEAQGELTEMQLVNTFISSIMNWVQAEREEGQTLVEYALIIALISLLVVGLALVLETPLTNTFNSIANGLNGS